MDALVVDDRFTATDLFLLVALYWQPLVFVALLPATLSLLPFFRQRLLVTLSGNFVSLSVGNLVLLLDSAND